MQILVPIRLEIITMMATRIAMMATRVATIRGTEPFVTNIFC